MIPRPLVLALLPAISALSQLAASPPELRDAGFELTLFAEHPDIVTPIGATFDQRGHLLVIESQTHFRTSDYEGPLKDRIRRLEDTDGDGRADRFTTFYEGLTHAMSIALAPDGSIYVATRAKILQLRDADADGIADRDGVLEIARLESSGDYPHNGLGGLAFDRDGQLWFGLGENLGEPYKLVGADGTTLRGGGEGGNIYTCDPGGSGLHRIATGFWNPFGLCFDPRGRLFCVDNDPDKTPFCRLLHVVPGGDYGYAFRYGRSGTHPLQAWQGELPGTLPIVAATGEAPCAILPFAGALWGTSWGQNRVEKFSLEPEGASWRSQAEIVVQGDHEFRPVDLALAPDGSLFFTDWVIASYAIHGRGRVWRLARKSGDQVSDPAWPELSKAEKSARSLHSNDKLANLASDDPFRWQAAVWGLVQHGIPPVDVWKQQADPRIRLGVLTAARWEGKHESLAAAALSDRDPAVQLAAIRWAADTGLNDYREQVSTIAGEAVPGSPLARAAEAALEFLDQ